MTDEPEPMLDVARGDPVLNRILRQTLGELRDSTDHEGFRRLVGDVLDGRKGLREVFLSPAFAEVVNPLARQGAEEYEAIPEEERQRLLERAEQQLRERGEAPPDSNRRTGSG